MHSPPHLPLPSSAVKSLREGGLGLVPDFDLSQVLLGAGGERELVVQPKDIVNLVQHLEESADLGHHLVGPAQSNKHETPLLLDHSHHQDPARRQSTTTSTVRAAQEVPAEDVSIILLEATDPALTRKQGGESIVKRLAK